MADEFLNKTYQPLSAAQATAHYDKWAATYDAEISENGYATPGRCAEALARHLSDKSAPILDFGCGTGLSGLALAREGFTTIDGIDPATEMLSQADARGLYRNLTAIAPGDAPDMGYAAICAIGVIGVGAAPPSVAAQILTTLRPGGLFVFSLNDHALGDRAFTSARDALTTSGRGRELFHEYGSHLPGINLNSSVYVIEKL